MNQMDSPVLKAEAWYDEYISLWRRRPLVALLITFLCLGWVLPGYLSLSKIPSLKESNQKLTEENLKLEVQIAPFRTVAAIWFPGNVEEGLKKLADKITKLENDQQDLVRYGNIARYDFQGWEIGIGQVHAFGTPIVGWTNKYIKLHGDGKIDFECHDEAIKDYFNTINKFPDFPYPYYIIALCYNSKGNPEWLEYANKSITIIEKIIKVPGHLQRYDIILNDIKKLINENTKK